jgi:hypothetical protein
MALIINISVGQQGKPCKSGKEITLSTFIRKDEIMPLACSIVAARFGLLLRLPVNQKSKRLPYSDLSKN